MINHNEYQVIGKTKDLIKFANLDGEASSTLSKIQMGVGFASVGQGIYEHIIHQPEHYIPKKGVNAGKRTDVFKRTSDGKLRYKFNIKKPKNVKFVSKAARAHYQKGLKISRAGKILGWGGVILTGYSIYQSGFNTRNTLDLVFGAIAFIPEVGWIISGTYFLIMTIYDLSKLPNLPSKVESPIQQIQRDKTYVAPRYNEFEMRKLQEHMQEDNIIKKLIKGNGKKEDFPQFRQGYKDR